MKRQLLNMALSPSDSTATACPAEKPASFWKVILLAVKLSASILKLQEVLVLMAVGKTKDKTNSGFVGVDRLAVKLDAVLEKNNQAKEKGELPLIDTVIIYFDETIPTAFEDSWEQPDYIKRKLQAVVDAGIKVENLAL